MFRPSDQIKESQESVFPDDDRIRSRWREADVNSVLGAVDDLDRVVTPLPAVRFQPCKGEINPLPSDKTIARQIDEMHAEPRIRRRDVDNILPTIGAEVKSRWFR